MKNIFKFFTYFLVIAGLAGTTSCKKEWNEPQAQCQGAGLTANASISDLLALSPSGDIVQIEQDWIIEGYVVSSDESGNYYTALVIQDAPASPTAGIYINLDQRNLYVDFPVGKKVFVKVKGLFVGKDRGVYKLGLTYDSGYGTRIGRIPPSEVKRRVFASCDAPADITPTMLTINDIQSNGDDYINTLIKIENVQFQKSDLCSTFALEGLSGVNKYLEDCNGNSLVMRNSGYADFASAPVPTGKGSVTAVLGKYNNTFQIYIRNLDDVQMSGARCDGSTPSCDASALTPNANIADLKSALGNNNLMQITDDWIIEATVTASDKSGNLYKAVYIADASGGIRLNINLTDLYLRGYHRGAKLRIKVKDLYVGKRNGEIQLGYIYNGNIGRIPDDMDQDHIFFMNENEAPQPVSVSVSGLSYGMVGQLVKLTDVKFDDYEVLETFAFSDSQSNNPHPKAANRKLVSCASGDAVTVRTSGYANFADARVRYGTGDLTGILSCYDANNDGNITNDELQIILRDIYDVDMNRARCDAPVLLETFGTAEHNEELDLTGWYNYAEAGTRKWIGRFYSGSINHYAQMSAYNSNEAQNIAWLISPPVGVTNGMTLSFQTAKAYWTHDALQVFVSTDFNGYDVRSATWTELNAVIATGTDPNHAWIDSGDIDLSAYAGQSVYIAFRYKGSGDYGQTGTYRIDNVVIKR